MKRIIFRILTLVMTCLSMILITNIYDLTHIESEVAEAKVDYIYDQEYEFIESFGFPAKWHDEISYFEKSDERYYFYQEFELRCYDEGSQSPFDGMRFPMHCNDLPSDTTFIIGGKPTAHFQIAIGYALCEEMIRHAGFHDLGVYRVEDAVGKKLKLARLSVDNYEYKLYIREVTVSGVYRVDGKSTFAENIDYSSKWLLSSSLRFRGNNMFDRAFYYDSDIGSNPVSVVYKAPNKKEELRAKMKDDYLLRHAVDSIYYPHDATHYEPATRHLYFTLSVIGLLVTTFFALALIFILYYDKNSDEIIDMANDIEELPWFIPHIVLAIIVPIIYHIQVPWLSILQPMLFGILYLVFIYLISLCIRVIYYSRHKKIQR